MKVSASVTPRCKNCQTARRGGKLYIICSNSKKHKQRQGQGEIWLELQE